MSEYVDGQWYNNCTIKNAYIFEANSGSVGIGIDLEGPHGPLSGALWLTEKAYDKTIGKFQKWGLTETDWQNPEFSESPHKWLNGKIASVQVELQSYMDDSDGSTKVRAKAANIGAGGGASRSTDPKAASKAVGIFQRKAKIDGDDIPF